MTPEEAMETLLRYRVTRWPDLTGAKHLLTCAGPHIDTAPVAQREAVQVAPYTVENLLLDMQEDLEDRRGLTAITPEAALEIKTWLEAIAKRLDKLRERGK